VTRPGTALPRVISPDRGLATLVMTGGSSVVLPVAR
jgi:hypothetical protein